MRASGYMTTKDAGSYDLAAEIRPIVSSCFLIPLLETATPVMSHLGRELREAITEFQSDEPRERLLRSYGLYRFTEYTITGRSQLQREFNLTCERGFAADREDSASDGCCFAVPITAQGGEVPAGISVSLPKLRMRDAGQEERFVKALMLAAREIAEALFN